MKTLSAVALSATTTGRLSVAADPCVIHHHTHLPAGLTHSLCFQVTSVCADCCGNHPTPASWIKVTAIFVQTNTEERRTTAAVLSDLLLTIVFPELQMC